MREYELPEWLSAALDAFTDDLALARDLDAEDVAELVAMLCKHRRVIEFLLSLCR